MLKNYVHPTSRFICRLHARIIFGFLGWLKIMLSTPLLFQGVYLANFMALVVLVDAYCTCAVIDARAAAWEHLRRMKVETESAQNWVDFTVETWDLPYLLGNFMFFSVFQKQWWEACDFCNEDMNFAWKPWSMLNPPKLEYCPVHVTR